jgi:hypothetical protein
VLTGMAQVSVAQDGIQKLLAAEQEAQQIIAKARKGWCAQLHIVLSLAASRTFSMNVASLICVPLSS